jgi:hypothetical protein
MYFIIITLDNDPQELTSCPVNIVAKFFTLTPIQIRPPVDQYPEPMTPFNAKLTPSQASITLPILIIDI